MTDKVTVLKGVEGFSVYINDYRVAGPKPWGGGKILQEWKVERKDMETALHISPQKQDD
jgi:hypothetical protein